MLASALTAKTEIPAKSLMHRPNTRADDSLLREKVVLCCGEDATEVLLALPTIEAPSAYHEYRCYRFWRFESFTLVWSGIGTGCLEPLLHELLVVRHARKNPPEHLIREIILIGTAGALPSGGPVENGKAYLIDDAYLSGSAVNVPAHDLSLLSSGNAVVGLKPHLGNIEGTALVKEITKKSVASSDYYYGFSLDPESVEFRDKDRHLGAAVTAAWNKVDMVDMETAQFYYFCRLMRGSSLIFASVRGPSNWVGKFHEQTTYSLPVLREALKIAFRLLSLPAVER